MARRGGESDLLDASLSDISPLSVDWAEPPEKRLLFLRAAYRQLATAEESLLFEMLVPL